jgi:hypothetical protein
LGFARQFGLTWSIFYRYYEVATITVDSADPVLYKN